MKINRLLVAGFAIFPLLAAGNEIMPPDTTGAQSESVTLGGDNKDNRGAVRLLSSGNKMTGKRYALVIGNAGYEGDPHIPPLRNSLNDARDLRTILKEKGFEVVYREDAANRREMMEAALEFTQKLSGGSVGLFYYAGHAVQVNNKNYLIPTQVKLPSETEVEYETMSAQYVLEKMKKAGNGTNIIILDACRDNPLPKRGRRGLGRTGGLAEMRSPTGSIISFATAPNQTAADGLGRNGTYTKYLLQALKIPGLTVEAMFKRVRVGVLAETNGEQVPWEHSSFVGEFCFSGCQARLQSQPQPFEKGLKRVEEADRKLAEARKREEPAEKLAEEAAQMGHMRLPSKPHSKPKKHKLHKLHKQRKQHKQHKLHKQRKQHKQHKQHKQRKQRKQHKQHKQRKQHKR